MNGKNVFSCAFGLGLAGGLVGIHAYMLMTPHSHRELRNSIKNAADELASVAEDIGQGIRNMR